jgi:hypothetical protein
MSLVRMSVPDLDARLEIDTHYLDIINTLIWENDALSACEGWPSFAVRATVGQKALYLMHVFASQVNNGGFSQYLWNCPELLDPFLESSVLFSWPELQERIEKVMKSAPPTALLAALQSRANFDFDEATSRWRSEVDDEEFCSWFYSSEDNLSERVREMIRRTPNDFVTG